MTGICLRSLILAAVATFVIADDVGTKVTLVSPQRWNRAVLLRTDNAPPNVPLPENSSFSSGFLVIYDDQLFLVTARHSAQDTSNATKILFNTAQGEARWVALAGLRLVSTGNPWVDHPSADVSVTHITVKTVDADFLRGIAFSVDDLLDAAAMPQRSTAVEITGFPMGLGTYDSISPLVFRGFVASNEISVAGKWEPEKVVMVSPPAGRGCSGGPVFVHYEDPTVVKCLGLHAGVNADDTGSKLSRIVPARFIRETILAAQKAAAEKSEAVK